jgi:hypothetical protein
MPNKMRATGSRRTATMARIDHHGDNTNWIEPNFIKMTGK